MVSVEEVMPKILRNGLLFAIERAKVPPSDFELKAGSTFTPDSLFVPNFLKAGITGEERLYVRHRISSSFFAITPLPDGMFRVDGKLTDGDPYSAGQRGFSQFYGLFEDTDSIFAPWPRLCAMLTLWASTVHEAYSHNAAIPDLWAELEQGKQLLATPHDNSPFSEPERVEISSLVQEIRDYIKATYELPSEQLANVEERLNRLERADSHLGRKDWLTLLIGNVSALVMQAILPEPAVQSILMMAVHSVGHLFGIGGGPPPHLPHTG